MTLLWLIDSRHSPKRDIKPVPAVNGDDCERQVHQFFLGELAAGLLVIFVGDMVLSDIGDGFRPCEGRLLAVGIKGVSRQA